MKYLFRCLWVLSVVMIMVSCTKESFTSNPDAVLRTSVDSLHFDTVFTTTGSVSQYIKIINENNQGIKLSSVRIAGGSASPFKINVDGVQGPEVYNVEVAANDSAYIFVTVTINPTAANLPFVVRDSIELNYNGNKKFVQLDAFGQNANFLRDKTIRDDEQWNANLPYVILGRLTVEPNATLTINKGTKIYIHADAPFLVHGTLRVMGGKEENEKVVFNGDRLDDPYRNFPASFPGIIFSDVSKNNIFNYAVIKNAYQGIIVIDPQASGTKLTLNETRIENIYDAGILALNTSIAARNLIVANCGKNIVLAEGGNYNFKHCTVTSYSNGYLTHKFPVLFLSDKFESSIKPMVANFTNCIFWGEENGFFDNEVLVEKAGNQPFNVNFNNVLWRIKTNVPHVNVTAAINANPQFDSINNNRRIYSFKLKEGSPAIDAGIDAGVYIDIDGNLRPRRNGFDLGAYEFK